MPQQQQQQNLYQQCYRNQPTTPYYTNNSAADHLHSPGNTNANTNTNTNNRESNLNTCSFKIQTANETMTKAIENSVKTNSSIPQYFIDRLKYASDIITSSKSSSHVTTPINNLSTSTSTSSNSNSESTVSQSKNKIRKMNHNTEILYISD